MLLCSTSALLRLVFATVMLVGLAHASSPARLTETVQPSWIGPLPLDGTPQEGIIGTEDDADYFHINVTERMAVVIYTTGGLNSTGTLLDSEGREIARSQGGGEGSNFHMAALMWPGEYYLRVDSSTSSSFIESIFGLIADLFSGGGSKTGSYNLHAEGTAVSPTEVSLDEMPHEVSLDGQNGGDYFHFELTEATETVIYSSGELDTIGTLLDSEGRAIASNDDGGEGSNFRISELLWPDEYYVRVAPFSASSSLTGSYRLQLEGATLAISAVSTSGSAGEIAEEDEEDLFQIDVGEPSKVEIHTTGDLDTRGALLDSEGREIAGNDDAGEGRNFRISTITVQHGRYYVRVSAWGSETGSYTLHAETAPLSATSLSLGDSIQEGSIEEAEGSDYFAFELTDLTETVIFTSGGLDSRGALLDSEGHEIASNDDGGEGSNFRISTMLWPGQYYVRVSAWGSETGSYTLHAEGSAVSQGELSLGGSTVEGAIDAQDEEDYFLINVTEAVAATIYTTGGLDTAGVLYDPEGRAILFNDDGGEGFINFRISAILLRPGQYFLRVVSSSTSYGTYTLHTEVTSESTADAP